MVEADQEIFPGSEFNKLTLDKQHYIREMRKNVTKNPNIVTTDGELNLKYFNVKKGQYWSRVEHNQLVQGVIQHGPLNFRRIKQDYLKNWSETEIRLRICRLLGIYVLEKVYDEDFRFKTESEITEAKKDNKRLENHPPGSKKKFGIVFHKGSMLHEEQKKMSSFISKKRTAQEQES